MDRLILQIIAGIISLFLATKFVPGASLHIIPDQSSLFGIQFTAFWQILILIGAVLGLVNFFIKPVLKLITFPLRLITLGFFSLIINMLLIWIVDILFPELEIKGIISLFWTSVIVWGVSFILGVHRKKT
jgi:putative membrane protein